MPSVDPSFADAQGDAARPATPPSRGGRPRSAKSRQAILDATMAVLSADGLGNLTIEGIAARAGVGKATIYRGWSNRIELALEAMEQLPELAVPDAGSLAADLRATLRSLAHLLASTPLQSVLGHLAAEGGAMEPEARAYIERRIAGQSAIFERAVVRGELPPGGDPELLSTVALGPLVNRAFFGSGPPDDAFIEFVVATVVTGLPAGIRASGTANAGVVRR